MPRAVRPQDTDWTQIDALYAVLERLQPSPVVTLNRAVAVAKVRGPAVALAMIEPLAPRLSGYFPFFGVKGALLLQLDRKSEAYTWPSTGRSPSLARPPRPPISASTSSAYTSRVLKLQIDKICWVGQRPDAPYGR
jgi:hypothetical protein